MRVKGVMFLNFLKVNFPNEKFTSVGTSEHEALRGAAESVEFFVTLPRSKAIWGQLELEDVYISVGVRCTVIPRIEASVASSYSEFFGFLV